MLLERNTEQYKPLITETSAYLLMRWLLQCLVILEVVRLETMVCATFGSIRCLCKPSSENTRCSFKVIQMLRFMSRKGLLIILWLKVRLEVCLVGRLKQNRQGLSRSEWTHFTGEKRKKKRHMVKMVQDTIRNTWRD